MEGKLKLIFAVDAIFPPITGIGRYAWELSRRLKENIHFDDVRFLSMGSWVQDLDRRARPGRRTGKTPAARGAGLLIRKQLSDKVWAVRAYGAVMPFLTRYRLRGVQDYLYHSPNFVVPPFGGKSVATIHDLSIYHHPETHPRARRILVRDQMKLTLQRAAHLITCSEAIRKEVIDYFDWPEDRITSIHLGVDSSFKPRASEDTLPVLDSYGLAAGGYSLCVATLEPRKRIENLLSAYARLSSGLRAEHPLVFAGDSGWLSEKIFDGVKKAVRDGWVRFLGYVPEEDLPILYSGARAFCYPSVYEGFGLPVLEAMASGIPVLTSNRSSMPEVAGGAALLVDSDDIDAITDGLDKVLTDSGWRAQAVERGLSVSAGKTWDRCLQETISVYERVAHE